MNTDSGMSRGEARIAELDRIIQTEDAKPDPDYQLIDDCIREIGELEGAKVDFSEEEVAKATGKILRKAEREKKRKRIVRYAAAAAAVVVLVGGVTACTVNPAVINWIVRVFRMPEDAIFELNGVTYERQADSYKSVSLLNLNEITQDEILFPEWFPENVSVVDAQRISVNNEDYIVFSFDCELYGHYAYAIILNTDQFEIDPNSCEVIKGAYATFYLNKEGETWKARGNCKDCGYIIECNSYKDLVNTIESMRFLK